MTFLQRTLLPSPPPDLPEALRNWIGRAPVYDSSSSPEARVYYIQREDGFFLKKAASGSLKTEATMTGYFHSIGLSARVVAYVAQKQDWLLTARLPGEDGVFPAHLENPERLCDRMAEALRQLHERPVHGVPVSDRTAAYLATARRNYENGMFDLSLFPDNFGFRTPEEAWQVVERYGHTLETNVLIHGDYCLPNILLKDWRLSGFIDLGNAGVADRHIDIFWGIWTLYFNLKTDRFTRRFMEAYGQKEIDPERLRLISAIEVFG